MILGCCRAAQLLKIWSKSPSKCVDVDALVCKSSFYTLWIMICLKHLLMTVLEDIRNTDFVRQYWNFESQSQLTLWGCRSGRSSSFSTSWDWSLTNWTFYVNLMCCVFCRHLLTSVLMESQVRIRSLQNVSGISQRNIKKTTQKGLQI